MSAAANLTAYAYEGALNTHTHTHAHTHTHTNTHTRTHIHTYRQTDRQTDTQTHWEMQQQHPTCTLYHYNMRQHTAWSTCWSEVPGFPAPAPSPAAWACAGALGANWEASSSRIGPSSRKGRKTVTRKEARISRSHRSLTESACSCAEWSPRPNNGAASSLASCDIQHVLRLSLAVLAPVLSGSPCHAQAIEPLPPFHVVAFSMCHDCRQAAQQFRMAMTMWMTSSSQHVAGLQVSSTSHIKWHRAYGRAH